MPFTTLCTRAARRVPRRAWPVSTRTQCSRVGGRLPSFPRARIRCCGHLGESVPHEGRGCPQRVARAPLGAARAEGGSQPERQPACLPLLCAERSMASARQQSSFDVLGLRPSASTADVKEAYRKLGAREAQCLFACRLPPAAAFPGKVHVQGRLTADSTHVRWLRRSAQAPPRPQPWRCCRCRAIQAHDVGLHRGTAPLL